MTAMTDATQPSAGGTQADWASAYRFFVADADGHLKVLQTPATAVPPALAPAKPAAPAAQQQQQHQQQPGQDDEDAHHADTYAAAPEGPQLPCLQVVPIEGRSKIAGSSSFSASAVNASPDAVQKMAGGRLASGHLVLAIARRDATIDVVLSLPQPSAGRPSDSYQPQRCVLIGTVTEDSMRVGMERWAGLTVGASGVYSCTSAGALRFTPVNPNPAGSSAGHKVHDLELAEPSILKLPHSPLTQVLFTALHQPAVGASGSSPDPTHFLYGGHEVQLSIWHLSSAFSSPGAQGPLAQALEAGAAPEPAANEAAAEGEELDLSALSGKQRKRKRQIEARNKTKELREGEVWRAKNLPNDALSLQQKPNISAIAILNSGNAGPDASKAVQDTELTPSPTLPAGLQIGVATRTGMFRIYAPEPGSHQGKAVHEFACLGGKGTEGKKKEAQGVKGTMAIGLIKKGVATSGAEVKVVQAGLEGSESYVADTQGKLYVLDWKTQKLLYQYPAIDGAVTSLLPIPAAAESTSVSKSTSGTFLLSTSLDRILRLHSTAEKQAALHGKANLSGSRGRGKTLVEVFAGALFFGEGAAGREAEAEFGGVLPAAPVVAVWDGVLPAPPAAAAAAIGSSSNLPKGQEMDLESDGEDEDEDGDDVWDDMEAVGTEAEKAPKRGPVEKKKRLA